MTSLHCVRRCWPQQRGPPHPLSSAPAHTRHSLSSHWDQLPPLLSQRRAYGGVQSCLLTHWHSSEGPSYPQRPWTRVEALGWALPCPLLSPPPLSPPQVLPTILPVILQPAELLRQADRLGWASLLFQEGQCKHKGLPILELKGKPRHLLSR